MHTSFEQFFPRPEQLVTLNNGNSVEAGFLSSNSMSKEKLEEARSSSF